METNEAPILSLILAENRREPSTSTPHGRERRIMSEGKR